MLLPHETEMPQLLILWMHDGKMNPHFLISDCSLLTLALVIMLMQLPTLWVVSSLVPIVGGVALASVTEISFNW